MSDNIDWRAVFKKYVAAVLGEDHIVAINSADDNFDGDPEEQAAAWAMLLEVSREDGSWQGQKFKREKRHADPDRYAAVTEALRKLGVQED